MASDKCSVSKRQLFASPAAHGEGSAVNGPQGDVGGEHGLSAQKEETHVEGKKERDRGGGGEAETLLAAVLRGVERTRRTLRGRESAGQPKLRMGQAQPLEKRGICGRRGRLQGT